MIALYGEIDWHQSFLQKDINENILSTSLILDPPTEREIQWDILALDTIRF
jgi:hypothetical protein